mgnify:CR=1 FL=1
MARRAGKAWTSSQGWVSVKPTAARDYGSFEDEWWAFLIWVFRWYPDKLLDIVRSEEADFPREELLQRVMMREYARKREVSITGTRSLTKTSTKMKYAMVNGAVWPGTQSAYYGPSYKQLAAIGSKTYHQIEHDYPLLAAHWRVTAESKDDFKIETDCGSAFYISAMRGDNLHDVTAEEYAQEEAPPFDYNEYSTVLDVGVVAGVGVGGSPHKGIGHGVHGQVAIFPGQRPQPPEYLRVRGKLQAAQLRLNVHPFRSLPALPVPPPAPVPAGQAWLSSAFPSPAASCRFWRRPPLKLPCCSP